MKTDKNTPFIFAVSGYKNSGKTSLITGLIPVLNRRGYKVAVIKHDGHDFEPDVPGTDSFRHRKAGAYGTAVFSDRRFMITKEFDTDKKEPFNEKILMEAFPEADIILIEGLKNSRYPKYICEYPKKELIDPSALADWITELMKGN